MVSNSPKQGYSAKWLISGDYYPLTNWDDPPSSIVILNKDIPNPNKRAARHGLQCSFSSSTENTLTAEHHRILLKTLVFQNPPKYLVSRCLDPKEVDQLTRYLED